MRPYLRAANVKDGALDLDDVKEMNFSAREQQVFGLRTGDVLVSEGSGSLASVGASAVWNDEVPGACFQNTLIRLRPRSGVDPRFLAWWSRHAFADGLFASIASGANIFHLSAERVRRLPIRVGDMGEQRAIADFLDAETARIDALITKKRALSDRLLERRTALTLDGVAGKLTSPTEGRASTGLPWLSSYPEGWQTTKLTLIARLGSGHTPSRDHPEWWEDCTIPWVTTGEVAQMREDRIEYIATTREKISELGMAHSSATLHPAGTVVLSRTASAGFSAIMGTDMATSQDFATWACGPLLEPRFLLLCLRAMRSDLLGRLAQGSTHQTIYMPDIEAIRVPLPPLGEQRRIVEATWASLGPIDRAVDVLEKQIALLRERRQALITAAVTGEIAVPGAAA